MVEDYRRETRRPTTDGPVLEAWTVWEREEEETEDDDVEVGLDHERDAAGWWFWGWWFWGVLVVKAMTLLLFFYNWV